MKPTIALTKGRLEKQFLAFLQSKGYDIAPLTDKGRKLQIETDDFLLYLRREWMWRHTLNMELPTSVLSGRYSP